MSYRIIYDAFQVKQGDNVIPFTIAGDSNVYVPTSRGQRRERDVEMAWWIADKENRDKVQMKRPFIEYINKEDLQKEWREGNITGLSLKSVIKRIETDIIQNDDRFPLVTTMISNMYYIPASPEEKVLLESISDEFNSKSNRILLKEEREEVYNKILARLPEGLRAKIAAYTNNGKSGFFHEKGDIEDIKMALKEKRMAQQQKPVKKVIKTDEIEDYIRTNGYIKTPSYGDVGMYLKARMETENINVEEEYKKAEEKLIEELKKLSNKKVRCVMERWGIIHSEWVEEEGRLAYLDKQKELIFIPKGNRTRGYVVSNAYIKEMR